MFKVFNPSTGNYYPNLDDGRIVFHYKPNGAIGQIEMPMHRAPEYTNRQAYEICANNPELAYHSVNPMA